MKYRIWPLLLAAALAGSAAADAAYTLHIDGRDSIPSEADLMIPLRAPAEELGYTVTWKDGTTAVTRGGTELLVRLGDAHYALTHTQDDGVVIDGALDLPAAPYLKDGVTYVPAALFAHLLAEGQTLTLSGETVVTGGADAAEETAEAPAEEAAGETAEEPSAAVTETVPEEAPAAEAPAEGPDAEAMEEAPAAGSAALANPFRDYDTLADAEAASGLTMTLPSIGANYNSAAYRAIPGELLEVIYGNDGTEALRIRKGADLSNVSGDYGTYRTIKTIRVDDVNVRMKGSGNRMSLATWERDGHAYAVIAAEPLTIADMMAIARETV